MNSNEIKSKIQTEINAICEANRNKYHRQYPVTKWAAEELKALGLQEYIAAYPRRIGQNDAQDILNDTRYTTGASGDEGWSYAGAIGGLLRQLAIAIAAENQPQTHTASVSINSDFMVDGIPFRVYRDALWSDGGEYDDLRLRDLPEVAALAQLDDQTVIVISAENMREAREHQEYLAEPSA